MCACGAVVGTRVLFVECGAVSGVLFGKSLGFCKRLGMESLSFTKVAV